MSPNDKPGTSGASHMDPSPLDVNLQLSFDIALEAVKYIDENDRMRGYESRRRFESVCEVVTFVAKTEGCRTSTEKTTEKTTDAPENEEKATANSKLLQAFSFSKLYFLICLPYPL